MYHRNACRDYDAHFKSFFGKNYFTIFKFLIVQHVAKLPLLLCVVRSGSSLLTCDHRSFQAKLLTILAYGEYSLQFHRKTYFPLWTVDIWLFLLSAIGCTMNFILRREVVRDAIADSPISIAFKSVDLIFYSIVCTISVTIPIALELLLDVIMNWRSSINDTRERLFVVFVISVPGILIFYL